MLDQYNIDQLAAKHAVSGAAVRNLAEAIERGGAAWRSSVIPSLAEPVSGCAAAC